MNQQDVTLVYVAKQSGLDFLQMLTFPFDNLVLQAWNANQSLQNFFNLFNFLTLSKQSSIISYLPSISYNLFLIFIYMLILLILLVIVDIIYVSYSFSRKKFTWVWPLIILSKIVPLFVTFLFLPITEMLMGILVCQNNNEEISVMKSYPQIQCWKGWHAFHASITSIFTFLFVLIVSIIALTLFQPRMTTGSILARRNPYGQVVFIINKTLCQFFFSVFLLKNNWFYIILMLSLSLLLYWSYNINNPYYDLSVSKFYRILTCYYVWTTFTLFCSKLINQFTQFHGGVVAWIAGLPFIALIIIFQKKSNIDTLLSQNMKFNSGQQFDTHLKFILLLIQKHSDKNFFLLLIGYIQKHKEMCDEDNCCLKKHFSKQNYIEQSIKALQQQINVLYQNGLKKYPKCTSLRLSYAFFLMENFKNKNKAYEEFVKAQQTNPSFKQEFIIYRFKKIIKEKMQDKEEENSDLLEIIQYDNYLNMCEQKMLLVSKLQKQFWNELKQDKPKLSKLSILGKNIIMNIKGAQKNYNDLQQINDKVVETHKTYAKFLIYVTKDNITADKILKKAYKLLQQKKMIQNNEQNLQQLSLVWVNLEDQMFGTIKNINLQFSQLTGWKKYQLYDTHFQKILPNLFEQFHRQNLQQWLQGGLNNLLYFQQNHKSFLKIKKGLIIPIQYKCQLLIIQKIVLLKIKVQNSQKINIHLFTNYKGSITDISLSSFMCFSSPLQLINENIQKILPSIQNKKLNKNSIKVKLQFRYYYVNINSLRIKNRQGMVILGNLYTLTRAQNFKGSKQINQNSFNFQKNMTEQQINKINKLFIPSLLQKNTFQYISNYSYELTNYAEGIKTKRLFNNDVIGMHEFNTDDLYNGNINENQEFEDIQQQYSQIVKKIINSNKEFKIITNIKWIFLILLLCIFSFQLKFYIFRKDSYLIYQKTFHQQSNLSSEINFLNKIIFVSLKLNQNNNILYINNKQIVQELNNHKISLNTGIFQNFEIIQGRKTNITIQKGLIILYELLMQKIQSINKKVNIQKDILYKNYFYNMFPYKQYSKPLISIRSLDKIFRIFLFLIVIFLIIMWIIFIYRFKKGQIQVLTWFLQIPIIYIKSLSDSCDKFTQQYQNIKNIIMKSNTTKIQLDQIKNNINKRDIGEQILPDEEQLIRNRRKLVKKYKNFGFFKIFDCILTIKGFLFLFLIITYNIIIFQLYQNFNFRLFIIKDFEVKNLNIINQYGLLLNKNLFQNFYNQRIQQKQNIILLMNQQLYGYHNYFLHLKQNIDQNIYQFYQKIHFSNICAIYTYQKCQLFLNGILQQGLNSYFIQIIQYLNNQSIRKTSKIKNFRLDCQQSYLKIILPIYNDLLNRIFNFLIQITIKRYCKQYQLEIQNILFYVYIVVFFIIYIILLQVYFSKYNIQINDVVDLMKMIPINIILKSNNIKGFLCKLNKEIQYN